jgi:hypothetical protein
VVAANRIDALLDPVFLDGLESMPLGEIRSRRATCLVVEDGLSYFRRLVQGRLDIVLAEAHRREAGGIRGDVAALVGRLPEILGDHPRGPSNGRLSALLDPDDFDGAQIGRLDAIVDGDRLAGLPDLGEGELRATIDALEALEMEASGTRRALHEVMDRLQQELVRRYKTGEATVDSLLP